MDINAMEWNAERIKNLRKKMGWGYADLARRLKCSKEDVLAWESGAAKPDYDDCNQLERFQFQLENTSAKKGAQPRAESVMKSKGIDQITKAQLDDVGTD